MLAVPGACCRVGAGGEIDAAKPVKEGLTRQQASDLLAVTAAGEGDLLLIVAGDRGMTNRWLPAPPPSHNPTAVP